MRENQRDMIARQRRRPGVGAPLLVNYDHSGEIKPDPQRPPSEIALEATGTDGEPAIWLDDFFWVDLLNAWSRNSLTVRIRPTPNALLHPVVLHQVNMLRRVAPAWRVAAHCYVGDLGAEGVLAQTALSPYHEIHIIDGCRDGKRPSAHALRVEDALARIRRVQVANDRTTPILVCRAASPGEAEHASTIRTGATTLISTPTG